MSEPMPPVKSDVSTWAMLLHLSQLLNFILPPGGIIAPIVIWLIKKDEMPELDAHGRVVVNWLISSLIYSLICGLLVLVVVGIFLLMALGVLSVVYAIIGALKAKDGIVWKYPGSISFF